MTLKLCVCFIGVLFSAKMSFQITTPTSTFYIGAVVEYHPVTDGENWSNITNSNTENYLKFLKTANKYEVDIIVFPEYGLMPENLFLNSEEDYLLQSSYVPHPKDEKLPCDDNSIDVIQAVKDLSCAARQYQIYVVVNLREKVKCDKYNCDNGGHEFYNTNVVFDRTGIVVAKYRKYHLHHENFLKKDAETTLSIFKTDFNVTFGQIISNDILFEEPSLRLVREKKITDILFPFRWNSEMPFMISNTVQNAWSFVNDVNFLGSGYNSPEEGSTGSGIYAGKKGVLGTTIWSEKRTNGIIISKIPKVIDGQRSHPLNLSDTMTIYYDHSEIHSIVGYDWIKRQQLREENLDSYTTHLFEPTNGTHKFLLCDHGFCCNFITDVVYNDTLIKTANANYYRYHFAVFKGLYSLSNQETTGVEICSVIACSAESIRTCGERFHEGTNVIQPTTFNSIEINGNFSVASNNLHLPISFTTNLQPLNVKEIAFTHRNFKNQYTNLKYTLVKPHNDLRTFAIYGRNFRKDERTKLSASTVSTQIEDENLLQKIEEQSMTESLEDFMKFELNHSNSSVDEQSNNSVSSHVTSASAAQTTFTFCYILLIVLISKTSTNFITILIL